MSYLLLPSLEDPKRHIIIENASIEEAKSFIEDFSERVHKNLKTKMASPDSDNFVEYHLVEDLLDFDVHEIADNLAFSRIPKTRGSRAVFVDVDTDTIIVGTTVVYNKNWATMNFNDRSIVDYLLSLQNDIDEI